MSDLSPASDVDGCWRQAAPPEPIGPFAKLRREDVEQTVPSLFERQVVRFGSRLAIEQGAVSVSYEELNRRSNRIAHTLLDRLGDREEPVALLVGESARTIEAILGVLKAGKVYAPIDPGTPRWRAAYILKDSQACVVVTDQENVALARELCAESVSVIAIEDLPSGALEENPTLAFEPDRLASLYYTSGSTGQPKGVPLSHRSRLVTHRAYANALKISSADRLALLYSCTFSGAVNNLYGALLSGASLFPFDLKAKGIAGLGAWLDEHRVTVYHSVPTVFRGLVKTLAGRNLPHLRVVILASDTVYEKDVRAFSKYFPAGCCLGNFWGASEAAFNRIYWVDPSGELPHGMVPAIGPPGEEEDEEILLLDESGQEAPSGQVGEIVLKTEHLTPGYWRKPHLTSKSFEIVDSAAVRLYRTGDLGRRMPDGGIVHLGRKDFQVQIRGNRVELEEVEAALRSLPGIRECAVTPLERNDGEKQLVGHVALEAGRDVDGSSIRRSLGERIPDYMIPAKFVFHQALPVTSGGKIDRKALRDANPARSPVPDHEPARDREESELVGIWEGMLGEAPIGIHDNFFDLGGDSMLALQVLARIDREFGTSLPLATLLEAPTVAALAKRLRQPDHGANWSPLVPISPGGSRPPLFLVHAIGGNVLNYRTLSKAMEDDQPVYGLQARGLDGRSSPHTSIEDMARDYAAELRAVLPNGPYVVGGASFGGVVAYEMACQMEQAGGRVDLLVLIDAAPLHAPADPSSGGALTRKASGLGKRAQLHLQNLLNVDLAGRVDYIRRRLRTLQRRIGSASWRLRMSKRLRRGEPLPATLRNVQEACRVASLGYRPKPYSGRVLLVVATDTDPRSNHDPLKSWGSLLRGPLDVERIQATHTTILDHPHVLSLARAVRLRTDRVHAFHQAPDNPG